MVGGSNDDVITDARRNPGWSIRIGISKSQVMALDEADRQGTWFDSVEDMDAYVKAHSNTSADEEGEATAGEATSR